MSLDASVRDYHEKNLQGPQVGQQVLEEVLADLQAVRISAEFAAGSEEVVGLDEVILRGP